MSGHLVCTPSGTHVTAKMLRDRFEKARSTAAAEAEAAGAPDLAKRIKAFQFRDIRPKAASEIESLDDASKLLGHQHEHHQAGLSPCWRARQAHPITRVAETASASCEIFVKFTCIGLLDACGQKTKKPLIIKGLFISSGGSGVSHTRCRQWSPLCALIAPIVLPVYFYIVFARPCVRIYFILVCVRGVC
ncbi:hypothetical protein J2X54_003293 [Duganella sp. 3397]|nr:hypothetical protein [Duganella sp. 3397]